MMRQIISLFTVTLLATSLGLTGVNAEESSFSPLPFDQWIQGLRAEAMAHGVSEPVLDSALGHIKAPKMRVIELDRNQPEVKLTFEEYLNKTVTRQRIKKARRELRRYRTLLKQVTDKYPIQPRFLVALWGMETDFGRLTGGFNAIHALATLAYDGRRSQFFRKQLLHALVILEEGHTSPSRMKGSWAGAMGQMQFMPSTFKSYAVDFTGDNKKDIWNTLGDSLASGANYLTTIGWDKNQTWGREVTVADNFDQSLFGLETEKPINEWQSMGVHKLDGSSLPAVDMNASLIVHRGSTTRYFLVYHNFRMLMDWNRSEKYATAVGLLADALKGY